MFNKPEKYFGLNDTYNVFTKEYVPTIIENKKYKIPESVNIQGEEWVAVNIGYIQLQSTLPTEYQLEILDTNGSSVLQSLTLKEGVVGVDIKPTDTECIWFNENGLRGNYYINSKWLGKYFNIKRGLYIGTGVGSDYFNELYKVVDIGASVIKYNNTTSKLKATNIQSAIDELQANRNIIQDSVERLAGWYYDGFPVYYYSKKGLWGDRQIITSFYYIRELIHTNMSLRFNNSKSYFNHYNQKANTGYYCGATIRFNLNDNNLEFINFAETSNPTKLYAFTIYYTKTTDSRII